MWDLPDSPLTIFLFIRTLPSCARGLDASTAFSSLLFTRSSLSIRRRYFSLIPILPIWPPSQVAHQGDISIGEQRGNYAEVLRAAASRSGTSGQAKVRLTFDRKASFSGGPAQPKQNL